MSMHMNLLEDRIFEDNLFQTVAGKTIDHLSQYLLFPFDVWDSLCDRLFCFALFEILTSYYFIDSGIRFYF